MLGYMKKISYISSVRLRDMNLVELNSVGSLIDIEEKVVYPQMTNGLPDLDGGVEVYQTSDEWFEGLSETDLNTLINIGIYEFLK